MNEAPNSLEELPKECLLIVLQNLAVLDWINLSCCSRSFKQLIKEDTLWRELALSKWGPHTATLAASRVSTGGWQAFCRHRMAFISLPASPFNLLQELFPDPWAHLACCLLCSRTTGGPAVQAAVHHVLSKWPTPSAILDADNAELTQAVNPLGLQLSRVNALKAMSRDFLEKDWELPSEFKGCGKFTSDSWRIFCRGWREVNQVDDVNLKRFLNWLNKGEEEPKKKRAKKAVQKKGGAAAGTSKGRANLNGRRRRGGDGERRVTRAEAQMLAEAK